MDFNPPEEVKGLKIKMGANRPVWRATGTQNQSSRPSGLCYIPKGPFTRHGRARWLLRGGVCARERASSGLHALNAGLQEENMET